VRLLVTGVAGFVGGHLVDLVSHERPEVKLFGLTRPGWPVPQALDGRVTLLEAELEDSSSVDQAVDSVRPDAIVHLAAQASPQQSWREPEATFRTNLFGLLHLLEACRRRGLQPRTLVVGSSEEYGRIDPSDLPLREDAPLRPLSPYATSKVAQGYLALQYALSAGIPVIRTRTFHHTGPGRGETFVEASFARQLAQIEQGHQPPVIDVGNLDAIRDFCDVRDVVRAYWALLERGHPGDVYNVCQGRGTRIREILDVLIAGCRQSVEVRLDPSRLRPADVPAVVGDSTRLRRVTGWEPRIPLAQTLSDLLEEMRMRVAAERGPA
jgi:GDP-4-dehydro-6-deoxy-D-mannose reductase